MFSRTDGFPATVPSAAPCSAIAVRSPSITLILIPARPGCYSVFHSIKGLIQHPKTVSSSLHPRIPSELMERYRHLYESSALLWDELNEDELWDELLEQVCGKATGQGRSLPNILTLLLGGREGVTASGHHAVPRRLCKHCGGQTFSKSKAGGYAAFLHFRTLHSHRGSSILKPGMAVIEPKPALLLPKPVGSHSPPSPP